jgi:hypothetical protein
MFKLVVMPGDAGLLDGGALVTVHFAHLPSQAVPLPPAPRQGPSPQPAGLVAPAGEQLLRRDQLTPRAVDRALLALAPCPTTSPCCRPRAGQAPQAWLFRVRHARSAARRRSPAAATAACRRGRRSSSTSPRARRDPGGKRQTHRLTHRQGPGPFHRTSAERAGRHPPAPWPALLVLAPARELAGSR